MFLVTHTFKLKYFIIKHHTSRGFLYSDAHNSTRPQFSRNWSWTARLYAASHTSSHMTRCGCVGIGLDTTSIDINGRGAAERVVGVARCGDMYTTNRVSRRRDLDIGDVHDEKLAIPARVISLWVTSSGTIKTTEGNNASSNTLGISHFHLFVKLIRNSYFLCSRVYT